MKKKIISISIYLLIIFFMFITIGLPVATSLSIMASPNYELYRYLFIIGSYGCLILVVFLYEGSLENYNLDRGLIITLVLVGSIRSILNISNEGIFRFLIFTLSLCLFYGYLSRKDRFGQIKWDSVRLAFILALLFVILFSFFESMQLERYTVSSKIYKDGSRFFNYALRNFLYQISFVVPFEELALRALLWGQLRELRISESKIFAIQSILFWILHIWQIGYFVSFFISLPVSIFIFSLLVKRSNQIFPAIVAHSLINLLIPIFVSVYR